MENEQLKFRVEELIDATSIEAIFSAMADICHEKAEHIQASYSDLTLARYWRKKGNKIEQYAGMIAKY